MLLQKILALQDLALEYIFMCRFANCSNTKNSMISPFFFKTFVYVGPVRKTKKFQILTPISGLMNKLKQIVKIKKSTTGSNFQNKKPYLAGR